MSKLANAQFIEIDLDTITEQMLRDRKPLPLRSIARILAERHFQQRVYAPGARYTVGERILFDGQAATIVGSRSGGNPAQGSFDVLTIDLGNSVVHYAAAVDGENIQDRLPLPAELASKAMLGPSGATYRARVQVALDSDRAFEWCKFMDGEEWALTETLPKIDRHDLEKVVGLIASESQTSSLALTTTESLLTAVLGQLDNGSSSYNCWRFALTTKLDQTIGIQRCGDDGWVLQQQWEQHRTTDSLRSPRQPTNLPTVQGLNYDRIQPEHQVGYLPDDPVTDNFDQELSLDSDSWHHARPQSVVAVLGANNYHYGHLSLDTKLRKLFPTHGPSVYRVTFHHRFGGIAESLDAYVDVNEGLIIGKDVLHQAFSNNAVYPGAKLRITHRGDLANFDLATIPLAKPKMVCVRRVTINEDGNVEFLEGDEPVAYDISGDVYIASARFDDIDALFDQAESVGSSIFQLMYTKSLEWWESNNRRSTYVNAQQLWDAVSRPDGRLTSKATIEWELWRRDAFQKQENGNYLFRPEKRDWTRPTSPSPRKSKSHGQGRTMAKTISISFAAPVKHLQPAIQPTSQTTSIASLPVEDNAKFATIVGNITQNYIQAKTNDHARRQVSEQFRRLMAVVQGMESVKSRPMLTLDFGMGIGRVANVPWLAIMDRRETESTQRGVYVVYLFKADMSGVYLTLLQGIGRGSDHEATGQDLERMAVRAAQLRRSHSWPTEHGFHVDNDIDLADSGKSGRGYERSTIAYKYYPATAIPLDADLVADLDRLLSVYEQFIILKLGSGPGVNPASKDEIGFLLGLILGKGEIAPSTRSIRVSLRHGPYGTAQSRGLIRGGGLELKEEQVIPHGYQAVRSRIRGILADDPTGVKVSLKTISPNSHDIEIQFGPNSSRWAQIWQWFAPVTSYTKYRFPTTKLSKESLSFGRLFMQGYACGTGLITDTTRSGTAGRHRVYIRASSANKEILSDIKVFLEDKLSIPVAGIHWHEGKDPQLRVYADDFEQIGFGLPWQDEILSACAEINRRQFGKAGQNMDSLFADL